ncbi:hypothetical protein C7271_10900 [filamentous cyanobacterium CCP5]|nr:hypothetical protein C7271_10900 [filamentous cyanobacterium CCP5]
MLGQVEPYWLENGAGQPVQVVEAVPVPEVIQGTLFDLDELSRLEDKQQQILQKRPVATRPHG